MNLFMNDTSALYKPIKISVALLRHLLKDFSIVNLIEKRLVSNSQAFWITSIDGTLFNKGQRKEAWIFLSQALGVSL